MEKYHTETRQLRYAGLEDSPLQRFVAHEPRVPVLQF